MARRKRNKAAAGATGSDDVLFEGTSLPEFEGGPRIAHGLGAPGAPGALGALPRQARGSRSGAPSLLSSTAPTMTYPPGGPAPAAAVPPPAPASGTVPQKRPSGRRPKLSLARQAAPPGSAAPPGNAAPPQPTQPTAVHRRAPPAPAPPPPKVVHHLQCPRTGRSPTPRRVAKLLGSLLEPCGALQKILTGGASGLSFSEQQALKAEALTDVIRESSASADSRATIVEFLVDPMGFCPSAPLGPRVRKLAPLLAAIFEPSLKKEGKLAVIEALLNGGTDISVVHTDGLDACEHFVLQGLVCDGVALEDMWQNVSGTDEPYSYS